MIKLNRFGFSGGNFRYKSTAEEPNETNRIGDSLVFSSTWNQLDIFCVRRDLSWDFFGSHACLQNAETHWAAFGILSSAHCWLSGWNLTIQYRCGWETYAIIQHEWWKQKNVSFCKINFFDCRQPLNDIFQIEWFSWKFPLHLYASAIITISLNLLLSYFQPD